MDATGRQDTGGYTGDGWNETTHVTVGAPRRADERSAGTTTTDATTPNERGVAGWLAVLVLDWHHRRRRPHRPASGHDDQRRFQHRSDRRHRSWRSSSCGGVRMFPVVVAPPLVYFVASAVVLYVRSGGLHDRSRADRRGDNWLVYGFPAIAAATAAVLIIAGIRMITHALAGPDPRASVKSERREMSRRNSCGSANVSRSSVWVTSSRSV